MFWAQGGFVAPHACGLLSDTGQVVSRADQGIGAEPHLAGIGLVHERQCEIRLVAVFHVGQVAPSKTSWQPLALRASVGPSREAKRAEGVDPVQTVGVVGYGSWIAVRVKGRGELVAGAGQAMPLHDLSEGA